MNKTIFLSPEMRQQAKQLAIAIEKHTYFTDVSYSIINLRYFCDGLIYALYHHAITKEDLQSLNLNQRTTSKGEHRHGMTNQQADNFKRVCQSLGYLKGDDFYLRPREATLIPQYGLAHYRILNQFAVYEAQLQQIKAQPHLNQEITLLQEQVAKLKTTNAQLVQTKAEYQNNAQKMLQLLEFLQKVVQTQQLILTNIKTHAGHKLSKDEFLDHYFDLTMATNANLSNHDVLHLNDQANDMSQLDYHYKLTGWPKLSFFDEHDDQPVIGQPAQNLDVNDLTKADLNNLIDVLYDHYCHQYTDQDGAIVDLNAVIDPIINKVSEQLKQFAV